MGDPAIREFAALAVGADNGPQRLSSISRLSHAAALAQIRSSTRSSRLGTRRSPIKDGSSSAGSRITTSLVSTKLLVKPHAILPLLPATMFGAPGSVTPVMLRLAPVSLFSSMSRARYQMLGTRRPRCMSLATMAAPRLLRAPPTAQLLLPELAASAPSPAGGGHVLSWWHGGLACAGSTARSHPAERPRMSLQERGKRPAACPRASLTGRADAPSSIASCKSRYIV